MGESPTKASPRSASRNMRAKSWNPLSWFRALSTVGKFSVYNTAIAVGAVLTIIAWFPDYAAKRETVSAFSIVRDNPTGILRTRDVGTLPDGRHIYDIAFELVLKNTSNSPFLVEFSSDRLFVGHSHYDAHKGVAQTVEDPPGFWDKQDHESSDLADWELLASSASIAEGSGSDVEHRLRELEIIFPKPGHAPQADESGGLTDQYEPEHVSAHTAHYRLIAFPKDFAAIEITYGIAPRLGVWEQIFGTDRSSVDEANPTSEIVWLQDATSSKCPFGVKTENAETSSACTGHDEPEVGANPKGG